MGYAMLTVYVDERISVYAIHQLNFGVKIVFHLMLFQKRLQLQKQLQLQNCGQRQSPGFANDLKV